MIKSSKSSYGQFELQKVFNKTNLTVTAITIGIIVVVLAVGNIFQLAG